MSELALFLCEKSTVMVQPWAEAGYLCYCVDIQHEPGEHRDGNIIRVGADLNYWYPPRGKFVFGAAFPPCTHLSGSGARWWKQKGLPILGPALDLFTRSVLILDSLDCPYLVENPYGALSTHYRKPDYKFDPADYGGYLDPPGDAYTKITHLWTGGGFVMPFKKPVEPTEGSKMHRLSPSKDRANKRSVTPEGFARAVSEANAPHLKELRA